MTVEQQLDFTVDLESDVFAEGIPHQMFRLMRQHAPVYWYDWPLGKGFWCITRCRDIVDVSRDHETFSSEVGAANLEDLDQEQLDTRRSMLETDPPRHTRLRGLVNKDFTPRSLAQYLPLLRELAQRFVAEAMEHDEFDLIELLAKPFPINVLVRLLGAPPPDTPQLIEWSDRLIGNTDPELADVVFDSPESEKYRMLPFRSPAALELFEYGHRLAAERRQDPQNDLVSTLVHSQIDGDHLTEREFDTMFLLLVVAGNETTRAAIAHGIRALIEHPDARREMTDNPAVLPTAVEEIIRWATPVLHFRRTATREVEMRGRQIRQGDKVVLWYISGNRDEEQFAEPFTFDIHRRPNDHVSFGRGGPHFCLGAPLARLEIRTMMEELLPHIDAIELAAEPERMRSNFTNAFKRMPVRVKWK